MTTPETADYILIVDDEEGIRQILSRWLDAAGFRTEQAESAEAALAVAATAPPAVTLCDVEMPVHDGLWLVERLRERHPQGAIVLATGVDSVTPTISLQGGVVGYVLKPFERPQLLEAVQRGVEWHRQAVAKGPAPSRDGAVDAWIRGGGRPPREQG